MPQGRKQAGPGAENHWYNMLPYAWERIPSTLQMGGGGLQASPNYDFLWTQRDAEKNPWIYDAPSLVFQTSRGTTETLSLDAARDRHIAHAYVETAFSAQARTADHVMIHADSRATNLIDQKSFYVGISRAKESVAIFTNDRGKRVSAISERAALALTAINNSAGSGSTATKRLDAGLG